MSQIIIEVKDVEIEKIKTYYQMTVIYNKAEAKKLFSFATPEVVWKTLESATKGQKFLITMEKDAKEGKYWNWIGIEVASQEAIAVVESPKGNASPTGTYRERLDFEQRKQGLIIRQSCLNTSAAYMAAFNKGSTFTPDDLINVAKQLEAYVLAPADVPQ